MPRDKNDSHVIILKNAKKEFLEFGFEKASMRSIAKKSGVTAGALYKHFAGKEEMFNALAEPVYKKLLSLFDKYTDSVINDIETNSDELFDDSVKGTTEVLKLILFDGEPERPRDAKGVLATRMTESYRETLHQARFSAVMDLAQARGRSPSFAAFEADLLAALARAGAI